MPVQKPTQGWRCKTCNSSGEVPGSLNTRADILLSRIVETHKKVSPECEAVSNCQLGYDQYGWFVSSVPRQVAHCGEKRKPTAASANRNAGQV